MQFRKTEIKEQILVAARKEFLSKGFEKASIRNITSAAKTSKSNVYNYFKDKDALFGAVVKPTTDAVQKGFEVLNNRQIDSDSYEYTLTAQKKVMEEITVFVKDNRSDFELLFFKSSGSSLYSFKDEIVCEMQKVLQKWISVVAPKKKISDFFVQSVARFYIGTIEQMLLEDLTIEETRAHFKFFLKFVYGGWNMILEEDT